MTTKKKTSLAAQAEPQEPTVSDEIQASEVSKTSENVVSTQASEADKITLDEYLKRVKVNPGLVASFSYEARNSSGGLEPRSEQAWADALEAQSNRTYS